MNLLMTDTCMPSFITIYAYSDLSLFKDQINPHRGDNMV